MSKIYIKGKVVYPPTLSGVEEVVKGARVRFRDLDVGNASDTILTKHTDDQGKFSGRSAEWKDTITTKVWQPPSVNHPFGRWVNKKIKDPTDVMLLTVEIKDGSNTLTVPFVYLGASVEHKLIVTWAGNNAVGSVNGHEVSSYDDLFQRVKTAVDSGTPNVNIKVYGTDGAFLSNYIKTPAQQKNWVLSKLGIPSASVTSNAFGASELLAIAAIVVAVGASVATVLLALAVLYAINRGYDNITGGVSTDPTTGELVTSVTFNNEDDNG